MFLAIRVLKIRRAVIAVGATDEQADEFAEAMDELPTKEVLDALLAKQLNRILLAQLGFAGVIVGAIASLTQL